MRRRLLALLVVALISGTVADLARAAYNAEPAAVVQAGGAPTAEPVGFVANVTELWRELRVCR
ncbi:hypothetical protein BH18ACT12_BH18ACT12_00120 [soil metagenome]